MAERAWTLPAEDEDVGFEAAALAELYRLTDGYPYFVQAYGKVTWDTAVTSPIRTTDVAQAAPEAEAELAVGFFGTRYERATPAERDYMVAMADLGESAGDGAVSTADIAVHLGRKPQSLSPARDGLIKKGLVFSGERGAVAFTVPALRPVPADPALTLRRAYVARQIAQFSGIAPAAARAIPGNSATPRTSSRQRERKISSATPSGSRKLSAAP